MQNPEDIFSLGTVTTQIQSAILLSHLVPKKLFLRFLLMLLKAASYPDLHLVSKYPGKTQTHADERKKGMLVLT